MKKIIIGAVLALSLAVNANAYYECGAQSYDGWGIGTSNLRYEAKNIAMYECQKRTSVHNLCWITYCTWR